MAGIPRGSIEHFIASSGQDGSRDAFVSILNHFDSDANMTRIASFHGNGGAMGFDYTGGTNPAGENAWAVWQKTAAAGTYHVLLQWSFNESFGTTGGSPADIATGFGVGIQMAYDSSGGLNIWNGGLMNLGADAKGTPVWVANGGNLVVFPRANGTGGSFVTDKEACIQAYYWALTNNRLQIISDDDYIWIGQDEQNDSDYDRMLYMGPYTPADGVTPDVELVMYQDFLEPSNNTTIGTTGNTDDDREGGVTGADSSTTARQLRVAVNTSLLTTTVQPNAQRSTPSHDGLPISLMVYETTFGLLGTLTGIRMIHNAPTHDTNVGKTKAFWGSGTTGSRKIVTDWDGATVPGTGVTIVGIQF